MILNIWWLLRFVIVYLLAIVTNWLGRIKFWVWVTAAVSGARLDKYRRTFREMWYAVPILSYSTCHCRRTQETIGGQKRVCSATWTAFVGELRLAIALRPYWYHLVFVNVFLCLFWVNIRMTGDKLPADWFEPRNIPFGGLYEPVTPDTLRRYWCHGPWDWLSKQSHALRTRREPTPAKGGLLFGRTLRIYISCFRPSKHASWDGHVLVCGYNIFWGCSKLCFDVSGTSYAYQCSAQPQLGSIEPAAVHRKVSELIICQWFSHVFALTQLWRKGPVLLLSFAPSSRPLWYRPPGNRCDDRRRRTSARVRPPAEGRSSPPRSRRGWREAWVKTQYSRCLGFCCLALVEVKGQGQWWEP